MSDLNKALHLSKSRSRAWMQALYRQNLADAGESIKTAENQLDTQLKRVGTLIDGSIAAGIRVSEIAEITGLSRQKIYDLRDRQRPDEEDLNMRILARLGAAGALTVSQLSGELRVAEEPVAAEMTDLERQHLVSPLMSSYEGGHSETHFKISTKGAVAVERWMLEPGQEPARVSVYAAIGLREMEAIRQVAIDVFGPEWFAIIQPGTLIGQELPELAFFVVADNGDDAVIKARARLDELRSMAGVRPQTAVITALAPAGPLHLTFGRDRDSIVTAFEP
jgi:hypothetical protein